MLNAHIGPNVSTYNFVLDALVGGVFVKRERTFT
jgi:hypothetical protein